MTGNGLKRFSALMVLVVGFALGLPGRPVLALNLEPFLPGSYFGPVTLSMGQSVRINVANLGSYSSVSPPGPCRVLVMFVDQDGRILNGKGRGRTLTLRQGNAASVQYSPSAWKMAGPRSEAKGATTKAVLIRGVVLSLTELPWVIQSSLEILDSAGRTTQILSPFEDLILNPQPLPPG